MAFSVIHIVTIESCFVTDFRVKWNTLRYPHLPRKKVITSETGLGPLNQSTI
jgi:hypothetical protein